jgi:hypothetical protein
LQIRTTVLKGRFRQPVSGVNGFHRGNEGGINARSKSGYFRSSHEYVGPWAGLRF